MDSNLTAQRQVIDKYKRELFSHRNHYRGWNLKDELHKLVSGSQEVIQHIFFGAPPGSEPASRQRISYEDLQRFIEQVLSETGYYSCQPAGDDSMAALSDLADADQLVASDRAANVRYGASSPLGLSALAPPEPLPRTRLSQHHLPPMQRPIPVCNNSGLASESMPTLLPTTRSCELLLAP